ncbi:hypothetical protein HOO54_07170 [Bacillus sp. WMMC1349]|uniref:hypothetical protein n=1 Tax=Bacillus sp. WMMC1349 TaxID=2736254 RepID=UPI001551F031|nr:hypothetical protein [Bacillus sp. WMMC1349]NPC91999.1 hypothetical protein [Bacillus sp. WMMC1349]
MKYLKTGDEYIEKKMDQFFGEAGMIVAAILFIDVIIRGLILNREPSEFIISGIGFAVYIGWIVLRYLLSGLEYPEVDNQLVYRRKRKEILVTSISSGPIFAILSIIFLGIPDHLDKWIDLIGMLFIFVLFHFLSQFISLHKSFKKNKDLFDE